MESVNPSFPHFSLSLSPLHRLHTELRRVSFKVKEMKKSLQGQTEHISKLEEKLEDTMSKATLRSELLKMEKSWSNNIGGTVSKIIQPHQHELDRKIEEINKRMKTQTLHASKLDAKADVEDVRSWLNTKADKTYVDQLQQSKVDTGALRQLRKDVMKEIRSLNEIFGRNNQGSAQTGFSQTDDRLKRLEQRFQEINEKLSGSVKFHDYDGTGFVRWVRCWGFSVLFCYYLVFIISAFRHQLWKSRDLTNEGCIPWEVQVPQQIRQPFQWDRGESHISVLKSGLYECRIGMFVPGKIQVQLHVNEEVAVVYHPEYVC